MLQKSSTWKALEIFFIHPTKAHYLMDISRTIKLAHTSVKKSLDELVRIGLVRKSVEKKGRRRFPLYAAKNDAALFRRQKLVYNLSSLFEAGIADFIEEKVSPKSIVLFGSYAKGEDTEESDIDVFVECRQEKLDLKPFERKLGRKIQLHFSENFADYPKELRSNIINGFVLSGFLDAYQGKAK